ncbi:uncharacterized protein isoform X1 [Leptinotarsa decemlineata]|uniref:uncharacterized protein isoform X1 n=2 Tax=Leptinotarsa decemlineata TaxID=7539 RepID=UPI003D3063F9
MSHKDRPCMYNENHVLQVIDQNGIAEEKNINLTIMNCNDSLQIKIRDPTEYNFNYTEVIDLGLYEMMRTKQNLDINFNEFKSTLLDLLQQVQRKEMFLKCETTEQLCTLVYYYKSKIKSTVYLTLDLHVTNQKEIFDELINNLQHIQDINNKLKKQLSNVKKNVLERDQQIHHLTILQNQLERQFHNQLKQFEDLYGVKFRETEDVVLSKIRLTKHRVDNLVNTIDILKKKFIFEKESSTRLMKTLESFQKENAENFALINQLKKENNALHAVQINQEKSNADLRHILNDRDSKIKDLQKKNEELRSDNEKAAIIVTQKKTTIDELSKDLIQANQMLVNFNNHYDTKVKQVEELQTDLRSKDEMLNTQKSNYDKLLAEYERYKVTYNNDGYDKLQHELRMANTKIEELEKTLRKANKINTLLTEKVSHLSLKHN